MIKKATKKSQTQIIKQNESHDWLGEAAENYVRYLFAREGFQVFAGSKWGADLAVHELNKADRWWRIEVRSTDKDGKSAPNPKPKKKLLKIADFVVNIKFNLNPKKREEPCLRAEIYPVKRAEENGSCKNPDVIYIDSKLRGLFFGKKAVRDYLNS
jgi:hypothetical protein